MGERLGIKPSPCHIRVDTGASEPQNNVHCAVCQRPQSLSVLSALSEYQPLLQTAQILLLRFFFPPHLKQKLSLPLFGQELGLLMKPDKLFLKT